MDRLMDGLISGWMDSCVNYFTRKLQYKCILGSIVTSQCVQIFRVITVLCILPIKIWSHAISGKHYRTLTN